MSRALITGIGGQDGSYLTELLLDKGYEVHGIERRAELKGDSPLAQALTPDRLDHVTVHQADIRDADSVERVVARVKPDEIYHLASQSSVGQSFNQPGETAAANALGTVNLLEAVRKSDQPARVYHASSSEMFGSSEPPFDENTPFRPRSPYACAKLYAHWLTVNYREAYGIHASNGILFNHESPRRGRDYVTRKITLGAARIKLGLQDELRLGNISARRDWGFAGDYVQAMWLMLQQDEPDDFVVATGEEHSVEDFVAEAFACAGLDAKDHVVIDPELYRPSDTDIVAGNAAKAKRQLGWSPTVLFDGLIKMMVEADLAGEQASADAAAPQN